ncbi:MAG: hypothetical protein ACRD36_01790, partial [Candidatus Acidiferrum sp.]
MLAVAALGAVLSLRVILADSFRNQEILAYLLLAASWGYGMVCGCLLMAGETEEGTQTFLYTLPGTRWRLWQIKLVCGIALVLAFSIILAALGFSLWGYALPSFQTKYPLIALPLCGVFGLAWGLSAGSVATSVLGAIPRAIISQVLAVITIYFLVEPILSFAECGFRIMVDYCFSIRFGYSENAQLSVFSFVILSLIAGPAERSRRIYCRPDYLRVYSGPNLAAKPPSSWSVLIWLNWRQAAWLGLGTAIFGAMCGLLVIPLGLLAWPLITLPIGLVCGITTFADEQQSGVFRFLGDQRFAIGRIWL